MSPRIGRVTADGNDFSVIETATAWGGDVRYFLSRHLAFGVGAHFSHHGLQTLPEHLRIMALYAECRYEMRILTRRLGVFGGVRGLRLHENVTIVDWTTTGWGWGALLGVNWSIISHLGLELEISETALRFHDLRGADGSVIDGTRANGRSFGLESGILFRF